MTSRRSCEQLVIRHTGVREEAAGVLLHSSGWDWRIELEQPEGQLKIAS